MIPLPIIEPTRHSPAEIARLQREVRELAARRSAVILAHNYQRPEVQDVADFVGDSLGLSRAAATTSADTILFAGVRFMAETASILSPTKRVLLPDARAGCSLADTITAEDVRAWRAKFPDYLAVGYVNTSAAVKAELDYCCTSGNVIDVIDAIPDERGILFLPDFFLGVHLRRLRPHRRIEVWMGECHVHAGIRSESLEALQRDHANAEVLVHPECGCAGRALDALETGRVPRHRVQVLSTEGMVDAVRARPDGTFIVATEPGILHRLHQEAPTSQLLAADPEAQCAYMKTVTLDNMLEALTTDHETIVVPEPIRLRARAALDRMVALGGRPGTARASAA